MIGTITYIINNDYKHVHHTHTSQHHTTTTTPPPTTTHLGEYVWCSTVHPPCMLMIKHLSLCECYRDHCVHVGVAQKHHLWGGDGVTCNHDGCAWYCMIVHSATQSLNHTQSPTHTTTYNHNITNHTIITQSSHNHHTLSHTFPYRGKQGAQVVAHFSQR